MSGMGFLRFPGLVCLLASACMNLVRRVRTGSVRPLRRLPMPCFTGFNRPFAPDLTFGTLGFPCFVSMVAGRFCSMMELARPAGMAVALVLADSRMVSLAVVGYRPFLVMAGFMMTCFMKTSMPSSLPLLNGMMLPCSMGAGLYMGFCSMP